MKRDIGAVAEFRWRGESIDRFEGFSDCVFAFAVTLLIVSLEVPHTFSELMNVMRGFGAFAVSFALLMFVWYDHYIFFRRYGIRDAYTIFLNSALIFVVLFYVYPLKFLFTLLFNAWMGVDSAVAGVHGSEPAIQQSQVSSLMLIYSTGFVAVFLLFALLFLHAYRKRDGLELNNIELFDTRESIVSSFIKVGCGLLSMGIAIVGGQRYGGLAGMVYPVVFAPALGTFHTIMGKRRRKLVETVRREREEEGRKEETL